MNRKDVIKELYDLSHLMDIALSKCSPKIRPRMLRHREALEYAIKSLEVDEEYDLEYEGDK